MATPRRLAHAATEDHTRSSRAVSGTGTMKTYLAISIGLIAVYPRWSFSMEKDQLITYLLAQWKQFDERFINYEGETRMYAVDASTGVEKKKLQVIQSVRSAPPLESHKVCWGDSPEAIPAGSFARENLSCKNTKYVFFLSRSAEKPDWLLKTVHVGLARPKYKDETLEEKTRAYLAPHFGVNYIPLLEMVPDDCFRLTRYREKEAGGEQLIELDFTLERETYMKKHNRSSCSFVGGKLILDKTRYCCIQSYELYTPEGDRWVGRYSLDEKFPDLPIVAKNVWRGSWEPKNVSHHYEYSIKKIPAPSESDFTLSAFGLPEPAGVTWPKSRWYLWFAAMAAGAFGLGWFLRRKAKPARS